MRAVLALLVLPLVAGGCAGLPPAATEWVTLRTSTSTQYYVVRGATSRAIFEALDANGLSDGKGRRAVGVTSGRWTLDWLGRDDGSGHCTAPAPTITLDLVVTLPQLDQPDGLVPEIEARWRRFAARVAEHEQRHVDIYREGAKRMKARMEAALARPSACATLQATIGSIWASQQAETDESQERFHLEDDGRLQRDRAPLQAQIDANRARLTAIESETREADRALDALASEIGATRGRIGVVETEMAHLAGASFRCSQSRPTPRLRTLCQQHDSLTAAHRSLVERHTGIVQRQLALREEQLRSVAITNDLIEVLNWTR